MKPIHPSLKQSLLSQCIRADDGHLHWPGRRDNRVQLGSGSHRRLVSVVRVLYGVTDPNVLLIRQCNDWRCVNPAHYRLVTRNAGLREARRRNSYRGRRPRLLQPSVDQIRELRRQGWTLHQLARRFKIDVGHASNICRNRRRIDPHYTPPPVQRVAWSKTVPLIAQDRSGRDKNREVGV
jgi:hypothetical protein